MLDQLDRMVAAHTTVGSPLASYLRPGLHRERVVSRFAELGLSPPGELVDLYTWHDGTDQSAWGADRGEPAGLFLAPFVLFPPLAEAASDYREIMDSLRHLEQEEDYRSGAARGSEFWRPEWFPILQADAWRHAVTCQGESRGSIVSVFLQAPIHDEAFGSIGEMATSIAERFESGRWFWSAEHASVWPRQDDDTI
jgi:cell wall assembly regulator SMI1